MKVITYIDKFIKNSHKIVSYLGSKELLNWMDDSLYLKLAYKSYVKKIKT